MTIPLRKDDPDTQPLTTADMAAAKRPVEISPTEREPGRPQPVRSEFSPSNRPADLQQAGATATSTDAVPLFPDDQLEDLRAHWDKIQTGFVDEPRTAVQQADSLVATTMQQLAEAFSREHSKLEQQWDRGNDMSTEDLRVAFRRYRSFFRRLLSL